jgi:hypothetical protein
LICTQRLIFGHYEIEDVHEAILCGDSLTVELWEQAKASFAKHGGQPKTELKPDRHTVISSDLKPARPEQVLYLREDRKTDRNGTAVYRVHKGPDEKSAMVFLQQHPVAQNFVYLVVETPDGNFCRDMMGIYKEDS